MQTFQTDADVTRWTDFLLLSRIFEAYFAEYVSAWSTREILSASNRFQTNAAFHSEQWCCLACSIGESGIRADIFGLIGLQFDMNCNRIVVVDESILRVQQFIPGDEFLHQQLRSLHRLRIGTSNRRIFSIRDVILVVIRILHDTLSDAIRDAKLMASCDEMLL